MSTSAPAQPEHRVPARERLLAAANELFYAEGVQTVGIDRIIDRAGVAKASLYNVFGSKEELVAAYLASRHEFTTRSLNEAIENSSDPREKILDVFDAQAQLYEQSDFNGSAFASASSEAPSGGLVEEAADQFRKSIRDMFTDLAEAAGASDPVSLGRQLQLVYDGAGLAGRMDHHDSAIAPAAREAVKGLLNGALGKTPRTAKHSPRTTMGKSSPSTVRR